MRKPAPVDHPVHELIRERFSPRVFAARTVEDAALRSLFEAARWAPSCFNEQPWSFILARRGEGDAYERLFACLTPGNQAWAHTAPVLMLSVARLRFARNDKPNRHAFHDVGLASAQMALQAAALGLGLHMMGGFDVEEARRAFSVPESHEPVAAIAVGWPEEAEALPPEQRERVLAPRTRKPVSEFVFAGRWGVPAGLAPT